MRPLNGSPLSLRDLICASRNDLSSRSNSGPTLTWVSGWQACAQLVARIQVAALESRELPEPVQIVNPARCPFSG